MFAKMFSILLLVMLCISWATSVDYACPASNKMSSCSPKCKDDTQCHGKKCCPNICNTKSCVPDYLLESNKNDGYKNQQSKTATGSYCGNVKCNPFEKCELDKSTKRQKCMRQ